MASYNKIDVKSKFPYMRVVMHLLEVIINNSFIIFQKKVDKATFKRYQNMLDFRKEIAEQLISDLRSKNGYSSSKREKSIRKNKN